MGILSAFRGVSSDEADEAGGSTLTGSSITGEPVSGYNNNIGEGH